MFWQLELKRSAMRQLCCPPSQLRGVRLASFCLGSQPCAVDSWRMLKSRNLGISNCVALDHLLSLNYQRKTMRKPALYKADANTSHFQRSPMSSNRPIESGVSVDEEVEITVGDVHYLLIPNQEVVICCQVRRRNANNMTALEFPPRRQL